MSTITPADSFSVEAIRLGITLSCSPRYDQVFFFYCQGSAQSIPRDDVMAGLSKDKNLRTGEANPASYRGQVYSIFPLSQIFFIILQYLLSK